MFNMTEHLLVLNKLVLKILTEHFFCNVIARGTQTACYNHEVRPGFSFPQGSENMCALILNRGNLKNGNSGFM